MRKITTVIALTVHFGCQTTKSNSDLANVAIPPITCESGNYVPLTLRPMAPAPGSGVVQIEGAPMDSVRAYLAQSIEAFVRLDYCLDESDDTRSRLKRIVFKWGTNYPVDRIVLPENAVVEGLSEAAFETEGARAKVYFEIQNQMFPTLFHIYRLDTWQEGDRSFATFARMSRTPDAVKFDPRFVHYGQLTYGDPVPTGTACTQSEIPSVSESQFATARIKLKLCNSQGGGRTNVRRIVGLQVEDSNASLVSPISASFDSIGAEAGPAIEGEEKTVSLPNGQFLKYLINHHNLCDSFYLKLEHAEYAATSVNYMGDTCSIVEHAPIQGRAGPGDGTKFKIRYNDGPWTEGESACRHYTCQSSL